MYQESLKFKIQFFDVVVLWPFHSWTRQTQQNLDITILVNYNYLGDLTILSSRIHYFSEWSQKSNNETLPLFNKGGTLLSPNLSKYNHFFNSETDNTQ